MIDVPRNLTGFLLGVYAPHRLSVSGKTIDQYGYAVRSLEKYASRPLAIGDLSDDLILSWLRSRLADVSPKTVKRERGDVLTIWRWAAAHGYCDTPPGDIPTIRVPHKLPVAWTVDEFERVVSTCRGLTGEMRGTGINRSAWWSSLMIFLYWSGARITAALEVRSLDVNMERRLVILRAETAKTGVEQALHLHDQAVAAIAGHYDPARELVWPYPYNSRRRWIHLKAILRDAHLPCDRYRMFHCIRRTTYTMAVKFGSRAIAQRQLGHRTDMSRYYEDPTQIDQQQAADVLPTLSID